MQLQTMTTPVLMLLMLGLCAAGPAANHPCGLHLSLNSANGSCGDEKDMCQSLFHAASTEMMVPMQGGSATPPPQHQQPPTQQPPRQQQQQKSRAERRPLCARMCNRKRLSVTSQACLLPIMVHGLYSVSCIVANT